MIKKSVNVKVHEDLYISFERESPVGSIKISFIESDGAVTGAISITPELWIKIMSTVSKFGDTALGKAQANLLHTGQHSIETIMTTLDSGPKSNNTAIDNPDVLA